MRIFVATLFLPAIVVALNSDARGADARGNIEVKLTVGHWPRIEVTVFNKATHELRIWRDDNSWGYENLSLALVMRDGDLVKVHATRRRAVCQPRPCA